MRKSVFAMIALMGTSDQAEILDSAANGFTLSNAIAVAVDPDETYQALVGRVDQWWPKDHSWWGGTFTIDPVAGGCFCERKGAQQAQHLRVTLVDPGKLVRMTGGLGPLQGMGLDGVLEFRLEALETGGTTVTMYYRVGGYTTDDLSQFAPVVDQVQALQIGGLKRLLDGEDEAASDSP